MMYQSRLLQRLARVLLPQCEEKLTKVVSDTRFNRARAHRLEQDAYIVDGEAAISAVVDV